MADGTDIEEIRERKRRELRQRLARDETADGAGSDHTDAGAASPDEPVPVADADDLSAFVERHGTVLVDFYADWCGPCRMMEPVVERLAAETEAAVAKVDADANESLAAEYGVRGLPTFVVFHDGERTERLVGGQDESRLRSALGV